MDSTHPEWRNSPEYKAILEQMRVRRIFEADREESRKSIEAQKQKRREEKWQKMVDEDELGEKVAAMSQAEKDYRALRDLKTQQKRKVAAQKHYYKNKDEIRQKAKEKYYARRQNILERQKKSYNENPEKFQKRASDYYEKNQEKILDKAAAKYHHEPFEDDHLYDDENW